MKRLGSLVLAAAAFTASLASGAVFTVTNTNDSGAGSLRQAILDANAQPNVAGDPDRINFNIPGGGVHTIEPTTFLPNVTDPLVIDGLTQPGAVANSNPVGEGLDAGLKIEISGNKIPLEFAFGSIGIAFDAPNSSLRGVVVNRFQVNVFVRAGGGGSRVQGCYISTDPAGFSVPQKSLSTNISFIGVYVQRASNVLIGGTSAAMRNLVSGNKNNVVIDGREGVATGNLLHGNLIGLRAGGVADVLAVPDETGVIIVSGEGNTVGGTTAGTRNVISGNGGAGGNTDAGVVLSAGANNRIEGNFIGTDVTGAFAVGNERGVFAFGELHTIGGSGAGAGNLISGNTLHGVQIGGDSANQLASNIGVAGNLIGTQLSRNKALGNGAHGVLLSRGATDCAIGGTLPNERNVIAFNALAGVYLPTADVNPSRNGIRGNVIHHNGRLGIKLGDFNAPPVPNDPGDADSGPNGLQNYPVLTSATISGNNVNITGSLNSTPSTGFRIDFYTDYAADPSGFGEGRLFLGTEIVTTAASGNVTFSATLPYIPGTAIITATAVASNGDTSEFSQALPITGAPSRLLNISTRLNVQTGENVLISGFIISGEEDKRVIVRGLGPSLQVGGVPVAGRMNNPVLEIYRGSTLLAANDDWQSTQPAEIEQTGIAPSDAREAAIVRSFAPGTYTAILSGAGGETGIALLDAYDLDQPSSSRLANVSTRGSVGTGDDALIGGVIIGGAGNGGAKVMFRAIGPSLPATLENRLQDPTLELYNADGVVFATNDDWKSEQAPNEASGIPPTDDRESALVRTLPPGNYTAVIRGKNGTTGLALVEAYNLP